MVEPFLSFNVRANGKTFYYLRIMAYHAIPLIVHNTSYQQDLIKQFYDLPFTIAKPEIYHIQDENIFFRIKRRKVIIDDPIVYEHDKQNIINGLKPYSEDELREIILTDLATGHRWRYDVRK